MIGGSGIMRIVVVGLGSMGKRRIRLLKEYLQCEVVGVDTCPERVQQAVELYSIPCFSSLEDAFQTYPIEAGVVCTSPLSHFQIAKILLEHNIHVFTELNLVSDGYKELIELAKQKEKVLFLSSTKLYRYEVKRIEDVIRGEKGLNYVYHIGQYLPDWHPWEDYRNFFVSNVRTNACREIFAIELPWLISLFGDIENIKVVKQKSSSLDIEYPDTYMVLAEHGDKAMGTIIVDVVSRKAVRDFRLFNEKVMVQWDGTPNGYYELNLEKKQMEAYEFSKKIIKDKNYADNIIENDYLEELRAYMDKIENPSHKYYDFEDDFRVLQHIEYIEGNR